MKFKNPYNVSKTFNQRKIKFERRKRGREREIWMNEIKLKSFLVRVFSLIFFFPVTFFRYTRWRGDKVAMESNTNIFHSPDGARTFHSIFFFSIFLEIYFLITHGVVFSSFSLGDPCACFVLQFGWSDKIELKRHEVCVCFSRNANKTNARWTAKTKNQRKKKMRKRTRRKRNQQQQLMQSCVFSPHTKTVDTLKPTDTQMHVHVPRSRKSGTSHTQTIYVSIRFSQKFR